MSSSASSTSYIDESGRSEIPRYVAYTSPVAPEVSESRATSLPLPIIALIVGQLDDIGDVARVTRTCRLLYYMTLPQLYAKIALASHREIRYVNGRPEGFGSGSPFMMALNGLVTKAHANLVQDFRVHGQWKEHGVEDFAKGRVPDNNIMLNILLRAATDRMSRLHSFSWELDCKPLKTLYQGLGAHSTLTSLTIKFPSSRLPRPCVMIPPMANLRVFWAMDIDPLCYPDDISMLLLGSKKLEDLRLHFSPRMRQEAESSLNMDTYFGRCLNAGYKLPLKHFAVQNFYGSNVQGMPDVVDPTMCKSVTFIDVFGGSSHHPRNIYLDDAYRNTSAPPIKARSESMRFNETMKQHIHLLSQATDLKRIFFINAKPTKTGLTPESTDGAPATPAGETSPSPAGEATALGKQYLHVLTRHHGSTLTHILFSDQWALTPGDIGDLVRFCPNLEQLGLAFADQGSEGEGNGMRAVSTLRLLLPFLPKLQALRILSNEYSEKFFSSFDSEQARIDDLSRNLERMGAKQLRWVGLGDKVYWCGDSVVSVDSRQRRRVKPATLADVDHVPIWSLDCLSIWVDPIARFSP